MVEELHNLCALLVFRAHADDCIRAFETIAKNSFQRDFSLFDNLQNSLHPQIVAWFEHYTLEQNINIEDRLVLSDTLLNIARFLSDTPVVTCTFAHPPRAKFFKTFYTNVCTHAGSKRILIDVIIDPFVIGGATFSYNGKFYNFSLAYEFSSAMLTS